MTAKGYQGPIKHGTTAGARAHKVRKIPLCEPCRIARNDYERKRHEAARRRKEAEKEELLIRSRILTRLAQAYPAAYERIRREELRKRYLERRPS